MPIITILITLFVVEMTVLIASLEFTWIRLDRRRLDLSC